MQTSTDIGHIINPRQVFKWIFGERSEEEVKKEDGKRFQDFVKALQNVADKYGKKETGGTIVILDGEDNTIHAGYDKEGIRMQADFVEKEWEWDPEEGDPSIILFKFDHAGRFKELEIDYV